MCPYHKQESSFKDYTSLEPRLRGFSRSLGSRLRLHIHFSDVAVDNYRNDKLTDHNNILSVGGELEKRII